MRCRLPRLVPWLLLLACPVSAASPGGAAAEADEPRVFCLDRDGLREVRAGVARQDRMLQASLRRIRSEADKALDVGPFSVVLKRALPPTGNRHDYMSLAPYVWPDPEKPGGLPYKGRDGLTNPEWWQDYDRVPLERLTQATESLALAYFLTGAKPYAVKAAHLLRVWFLEPATAMIPDLQFAQAVPGRHPGRPHAIDTRFLTRVVDAVGLLAGSEAWTAQDQAGMVEWFRTFVSNQRRRMDDGYRDAPHNIATFYHAQVAAQALFTGDLPLAREMIERTKARLAQAVGTDGTFTVERNRTRSLSYSCFHAFALFNLATMGRHVGIDLWNYQTADGRGFRPALARLAAHAGPYPPSGWPFQEAGHTPGDWWDPFHDELPVVLFHAARVYGEKHYEALPARILESRDGVDVNLIHLRCGLPLIGEQAIHGWLFRPGTAEQP